MIRFLKLTTNNLCSSYDDYKLLLGLYKEDIMDHAFLIKTISRLVLSIYVSIIVTYFKTFNSYTN
jgi:hypothetical protein